MRKIVAIAAVAGLAAGAAAQSSIIKPPDLGPFWQPINGDSGTYVYASDFVLDTPDTTVESLGMWLLSLSGTTQSIRFEIWGDTGGSGPDPFNVLASTGSINPAVGGSLDYFEAPASGTLVAGERYWFAATVVGESGGASYQTGGHTQNSVYPDNGTFWFSNDPAGVNFDGRNLTPQFAFGVNLIPAPSALALLGMGGLLAARRRR